MGAFLHNPALRFVLFGGKGGTGKTTSAAAAALHFARLWPARKVLLVSTDPAHSLADSLACPVGGTAAVVAGIDNLFALALDAKALLAQFKSRYGPVIAQIADRGTYLDKEDIAGFLDLSLPGIDEVTAILQIIELMNEGQYALVILDTAPAGHTIRLLALPEQMEQWIRVMDRMQEKHRFMVKTFARRYVPDAADHFLETLAHDVQHLRDLLRNADCTEFVPVVNAEAMSIDETALLLAALHEGEIPVQSVIVNRLVADAVGDNGAACPFCQARARDQAPYLGVIEAKFGAYDLVRMPLFPTEIRGLAALAAYAGLLFDEPAAATPATLAAEAPGDDDAPGPAAGPTPGGLADLLGEDRQFLLFGGKGGVGKTTLAAATAVALAQRHPAGKTLIFSTDPTGTLAGSLGCTLSDQPAPVPDAPGLWAMQINAAERLEELKQIYMDEIDEVFNNFMGSSGAHVAFDREISLELVSMIPPGMDEIVALIAMIELIDDGSYDRFVLDTAPTGHMLRLLEMPQMAIEWFRTLFHLLLKYQGASAMAKTTQLLLDTSRGVKKVRARLTDPERSEFVAITIAEAMGVLETERLLAALTGLQVPCHHLVVNLVMPPTACAFCRGTRAEQQRYIAALRARYAADYAVREVPLFAHDIRGLAGLRAVGEVMFG